MGKVIQIDSRRLSEQSKGITGTGKTMNLAKKSRKSQDGYGELRAGLFMLFVTFVLTVIWYYVG